MRLLHRVLRRKNSPQHQQVVTPSQDFTELQRRIRYSFRDPSLLDIAMIHRSFLHCEDSNGRVSNERLEFLGDAVLNLVVSEHLYRAFPTKQEGELTQIKSLIVSRSVIAEKARELQLGCFLTLSPGEEQSGGRTRISILSDGFEALLGAMYLDGGKKVVTDFLRHHVLNDIDRIISDEEHTNYKSFLLEYCQGVGKGQPLYSISQETGPDHEKEFTVVVKIEGRTKGSGVGRNKREAEQRAAKEALEKIQEKDRV